MAWASVAAERAEELRNLFEEAKEQAEKRIDIYDVLSWGPFIDEHIIDQDSLYAADQDEQTRAERMRWLEGFGSWWDSLDKSKVKPEFDSLKRLSGSLFDIEDRQWKKKNDLEFEVCLHVLGSKTLQWELEVIGSEFNSKYKKSVKKAYSTLVSDLEDLVEDCLESALYGRLVRMLKDLENAEVYLYTRNELHALQMVKAQAEELRAAQMDFLFTFPQRKYWLEKAYRKVKEKNIGTWNRIDEMQFDICLKVLGSRQLASKLAAMPGGSWCPNFDDWDDELKEVVERTQENFRQVLVPRREVCQVVSLQSH